MNPATLVIIPPNSGLDDVIKPSAGLIDALSEGNLGGPHTSSRSSRMLFSATAGPQLGGFQFCVADLKQEFKNLPHDGTKKKKKKIPGAAAWQAAQLSAAQIWLHSDAQMATVCAAEDGTHGSHKGLPS